MSFSYLYREVFACASTLWPWVTALLANATLLLIVLAFAGPLLSRRNPPLRHLVGTLGLGCLTLLPLISVTVGRDAGLRVALRDPFSALSGMAPLVPPAFIGTPDLATIVLAVWAAGAALILARLAVDVVLLEWHTRRRAVSLDSWNRRACRLALRLGIERPVRVLHSDAVGIPCTWGFLRPVILLPASALAWDDERREAVLLHELGHIGRHDGLSAMLSRIACAIYWFHPLAWWIARGAGEDAERACDRLVIESGLTPQRYARHMLQIVRDARRPAHALAPSMAAESQLARRIASLLDPRPSRSRTGRAAGISAAAGLVIAVLALATMSAPAASIDIPGPGATGQGCTEPAAPVDSSTETEFPQLSSEEPDLFTPTEGYR